MASVREIEGATWIEGYDAAIDDAIALIDGFRGPSLSNFSAPVLVRLRLRLLELGAKANTRAA